jgi:hypothetical protein
MACCVRDCTFSVNGSSVDLYSFQVTDEAQQVHNVSTFESVVDAYLACGQAGGVTFSSFAPIGVAQGDTAITWSANVCGDAFTGNCACTSFSFAADRTNADVIRYNYTTRLESISAY